MRIDRVDPRDVTWEEDRPAYRVYFWKRGSAPADVPPELVGFHCDERRVLGAVDVHEVIGWAEVAARPDRTYTLYVEHRRAGDTGLIRLAGTDPTVP